MKTRVAISFDDGLLAQFKWARGLFRYNITGTFYVNPFYIDHAGFLSLDQLKKMKNEWGHVIANHLWLHESPASVDMDIIFGNLAAAGDWLERNGFGDGSRLLALPYGSVGGKWTEDHINVLLDECEQIRDVGSGINDFGSSLITAVESTDVISVENKLLCYYFHGNHNTSDHDFISLLEELKSSDFELSSMLEELEHARSHAIS